MKIGVLGTGMVGEAIATKLVALGHDVMMGSRDAQNPAAHSWAKDSGGKAGTFADAARFGELLFNCSRGVHSIDALTLAQAGNVGEKILIDVANRISEQVRAPESLGEAIQAAFPNLKVVKALNTINYEVMVDPDNLGPDHTIFMCGNDPEAKETVRGLLRSFGWKDIVDVGDISTARGTEAYVSLWLYLWKSLDTVNFNVKLVR